MLSADSVALRKGLRGLYSALTQQAPLPPTQAEEEGEEGEEEGGDVGVGVALNVTQLAMRCPELLLKVWVYVCLCVCATPLLIE